MASDILQFLKINRRIVNNQDNVLDDLIYRVCAHTGLQFDQAQEVVFLLFEEMISEIFDHNQVKLFFGILEQNKQYNKVDFKANQELDLIAYE